MKYPLFAGMGKYYPVHLEARFERILREIAGLWDSPKLHDYLSDLLIDRRGDRDGFPAEVMQDLIRIREFRDLTTFRASERKADALKQLRERNVALTDSAFLRAFASGDKELIALYVKAQFRMPARDEQGEPLLLSALKRGHTIVAKILLESNVDVNVRDTLGLTPLLVACGKPTSGYRVIAEKLIAKGADVNARDAIGNTPLLLALTGGRLDIARVLILSGADVSARSRAGESPLSLIMKRRGPEATEIGMMLLHRNAIE